MIYCTGKLINGGDRVFFEVDSLAELYSNPLVMVTIDDAVHSLVVKNVFLSDIDDVSEEKIERDA